MTLYSTIWSKYMYKVMLNYIKTSLNFYKRYNMNKKSKYNQMLKYL